MNSLEQEVDALSGLEDQVNQLSDAVSDLTQLVIEQGNTIKEQNNTINEQGDTISDLEQRIEDLEGQNKTGTVSIVNITRPFDFSQKPYTWTCHHIFDLKKDTLSLVCLEENV